MSVTLSVMPAAASGSNATQVLARGGDFDSCGWCAQWPMFAQFEVLGDDLRLLQIHRVLRSNGSALEVTSGCCRCSDGSQRI